MKIAIIGSGVSGLVVARGLAGDHEIVVFEASDRVGGHVHTHQLDLDGRSVPVDTGFIVFNPRNYPGFVALLDELGVDSKPSTMSFSVQSESGLEYNGTGLNQLFAQRSNLLRPSFHRMIRDILRFHREAPELLVNCDPDLTLGTYLDRQGYSQQFQEHYIYPMGASIWSGGPRALREFPAQPFVRFFHNHGMLTVNDRPEWRVVQGGSHEYVRQLIRPFQDSIRVNSPVTKVARTGRSVVLTSKDGGEESFDHVVLAVHSDQALAMLGDPSAEEREILGAMPYQENEAILHTDERLLPRRRRAWASWNFYLPRKGASRVTITYNMNILQGLDCDQTVCVTLNRTEDIDPASILQKMSYHHPIYTVQGFRARRRWAEISGVRRTHYCGAYWGHGFHEDGLQSALRVTDWFAGRPVGKARLWEAVSP